MHTKKLLSIGFITMLLMTLAIVVAPVKSVTVPAQSMFIDPTYPDPSVVNLTYCDTFTVDAMVNVTSPTSASGTGMFGYEYKLFWDPTNVNLSSYSTHIPAGWAPPAGFLVKDETGIWVGGIKDGLGYHWYGYTCLTGPVFTGVMSLCTYDFHVVDLLVPPGGENMTLDLQDVKLVDDTATTFVTDIPPAKGTVQDGMINKAPPPPPPKTKLGILPSVVQGVCGQEFNVTLEIENFLDPRWDLCGWEAKLTFDPSILTATNSYEGSFLPGFAGPNGTFYLNIINNTLGVIHTAGMFLGAHTTPTGTGVLAILQFNASWQYTLPPLAPGMPGTFCELGLYDTQLVDCNCTTQIPHDINNATYNAPYKTLGWALDCWTDDYRKKCETPFVGKGPNMNADAYEPQDMVIIFSELTYNQQPECNKTIMFEIYGPQRAGSHNISIYRTARTNCSGVATINFTIPWVYPNPEATAFGKWICFQKAQVKNPWLPGYVEKPNDTLWFEVGWIVELLDVEVSDPIRKCELLNITVWYKNIMMIAKNVTLTFTVLDDLLDPIGDLVMEFTALPGVWCSPYYGMVSGMQIHIPYWTHNGPRCRIYVNALTALPSQCGCYYCPEISVAFTVIYP